MATLASLTLDVEELIFGQTPLERPAIDTLETAVDDASDTSWRFDQAGNQFWRRGDFAEELQSDGTAGEIIRFAADHDTSGADVTVLRSQKRTTAAGGFSLGDVFQKNPKFTRTEIQRQINAVIDSDLQRSIWYRTERTLDWETNRTHYPLNASDFKVERVYQYGISGTSLGDATYDETGGGVEDEWTLTAHGLSVGDPVRFTAAGGGATGYTSNTVYWVVSVPDANTFTISATEGGSAIAGTGDSTGTWTLESVEFNYRELDPGYWSTTLTTQVEPTGGALLLRRIFDEDRTVHYVARTRPSSSAISSLPTELANLIPWGVVARLVGGTAVRSRYTESAARTSTVQYADAGFFASRFEQMVADYREKLREEIAPPKRWVYGPEFVG